jgi:hypothetical protein
MKFRPINDWFSFKCYKQDPWVFGAHIAGTMPEGFSIMLIIWHWNFVFSCVFGEWE